MQEHSHFCAFILIFPSSLNVPTLLLLSNLLSDKTLLSRQGLFQCSRDKPASVWMSTLTFTSFLIWDTLWIYLILNFSTFITGTTTSEGYFEEFNDALHVKCWAHFLVHHNPSINISFLHHLPSSSPSDVCLNYLSKNLLFSLPGSPRTLYLY